MTIRDSGLLFGPPGIAIIALSVSIRFRVIQPTCPVSFFVLVLQSCFGVFVQSLMTGLIFSKLARPKQRAHTIMFSRHAVICQRDCEYQLLFRVGDMRRSHIIATSIRALMVKDRSSFYVAELRGVQRHPRRRKMRHRNARGAKIRKLGGETKFTFLFQEKISA